MTATPGQGPAPTNPPDTRFVRSANTGIPVEAFLSAIEDLNRSIDTIGLLLFGQKYPDHLEHLQSLAKFGDTP